LVLVLISGGLAVLTLHLIENPLRFAAHIRRSPGRSLALGGVATAVAVCVCVALLALVSIPVGRGAPAAAMTVTASAPPSTGRSIDADDAAVQQAFAQVQAAVAAAAELKDVPSNLNPPLADAAAELNSLFLDGCMLKVFQVKHPECASSDTASTTTVALVGDSHAAMWSPALQQVTEQRRWRLETLTKADCPLMDVLNTNALRRLASSDCEQWRSQIMARLRAEHPRLIVVSMWRGYGAGHNWLPGFTSFDSAWIDSLTHLVQDLRGTGAKVLVLGPVPDPHTAVPVCVSGHLDDATACAPTTSTAVNASGIAAESAATKAGGGQYVDVTALFCTAHRCPVIVGDTLVYFDWCHVTFQYSRQLAPVIAALADRELAGG
jgi:hypothetical protein